MPKVTMQELLEAGIHFGHQTRRWNPKMKKYIFGARNGIYIIDLQKTLRQLNKAIAMVRDVAAKGGNILFVGTKRQAQDIVQREAERCGQFYVNSRWLGGTLTNHETMKISIKNLRELENSESSGDIEKFSKKEGAKMRKQRARLAKNLDGFKNMPGLPQLMFVVDSGREGIAINEARRLRIPCIGIVDTNADPDDVNLAVPGNDDALRAVTLFCSTMADAVIEGRAQAEQYVDKPVEKPAPVVEELAAEAAAEEAPAEAVTEAVAEEAPVVEATEEAAE